MMRSSYRPSENAGEFPAPLPSSAAPLYSDKPPEEKQAILEHGLTKGALSRDFSWSPPGTLHPRVIPGPLPWRVKFGREHLTETFVLRVFKESDVEILSWVQHTPRRASNSS